MFKCTYQHYIPQLVLSTTWNPFLPVPCKPVPTGTKVTNEDMCIIEAMPVKSLITYPKSGAVLRKSKTLKIKSHAWAGDTEVQLVTVLN